MDSIWFKPELSEEIMKNDGIFNKTQNIATDIISNRLDVTLLIENMAGVLINKEVEKRELGMLFFSKLLKDIPKDYLSDLQVKFISKFYVDRLKDNHRVIPAVLDGYLTIITMGNYDVKCCGEFFVMLFREVPCQSQVREDRLKIYSIIQNLMNNDLNYIKTLGPDFVYGFISAMDGEKDPRNLMLLFGFLPKFISEVPLGHLSDAMFEVVSCYYPIDFHPSSDDPAQVTRNDLAEALCPCLCASPDFAEQCLILLVEKLDSSLKTAKLDSLKLLAESCKNFKPESYHPFLKTLWSSLNRDLKDKSDDELKMAAHEALQALVAKLASSANTDQSFETFVKGIIITLQQAIAEATTVAQFVQATRVLKTVANSSKESCLIITKLMIPATLAYYDFKTSNKLQIASIEFLGDLYELAKHWQILDQIQAETKDIPQICLTAVSERMKEFQVVGFRTLIKVNEALPLELVVPFIEVLVYNIHHEQDKALINICVETVHTIAKIYPDTIMMLVVKGKCDLDNLFEDNVDLEKRLHLLINLASIDSFTDCILETLLKLLLEKSPEASKVVEVLSDSISDESLYSLEKINDIENRHGLIDSVLLWVSEAIQNSSEDVLIHGLKLISNAISSLNESKQMTLLLKHTESLLLKCKERDIYFLILEAFYSPLHRTIYNQDLKDILSLSIKLALLSEIEIVRRKACILISQFLNKSENGVRFDFFYNLLTSELEASNTCTELIHLYAFITKALLMRGSNFFSHWLERIVNTLEQPQFCDEGSNAVKLIMLDSDDVLTERFQCRISLLYRQRMFQNFLLFSQNITIEPTTREAYLLSWSYVLEKTPKTVLNNEVDKVAPLVIDSLELNNKDMLLTMLELLDLFVQRSHLSVAQSVQTILPRLVKLATTGQSMDVRMKSLQCLHDIANVYPTLLLLPYKQDLLYEIAPSLDDKKRLVRNMAVKARTRWFLIGAPGENKEK